MKKKIKLIIEIAIFVIILCIITVVYYFSQNQTADTTEAASVGIVDVNDKNFETEVLNSEKPVVAEFSSKSCPPCVAMLTTLIDIAKNNSDIKIVTIDTDSKKSSELTEKYEVSATPTLIIFDNGKKKNTIVGATGEKEIMNALGK